VAQKISVVLVDDLDGSEAHETVSFGLDGATYEIDLNKANAQDLRIGLAPFQAVARVTSKAPKSGPSKTRLVREWAREIGLDVSSRGTIPAEIVQQYEAAH